MHGENNAPRIQVPGQARVVVSFTPGPNATPVILQMQTTAGLQVNVYGGMTRLEHTATEIYAALVVADVEGTDNERIDRSVDQAVRLLAACVEAQTREDVD